MTKWTILWYDNGDNPLILWPGLYKPDDLHIQWGGDGAFILEMWYDSYSYHPRTPINTLFRLLNVNTPLTPLD